MLKRELKVNFKNFLIWLLILMGIFLVVYLVYPSIITNNKMINLDEMMAMFPEELLKTFNMDIASIDSAFGWVKSEGWIFVLLLMGVYSGLLGSNILLKEESDKTIEYLNSLPIRRRDIVKSKVITGFIYIFLITILFGIFNYIALSISGSFDKELFIWLSITPLLTSSVIFSLCLFLSTFFNKTKKTLGISLGIVFISYFLNMLASLSENVAWLKYFSIFTLADIRNVILDVVINPVMIIIAIVLSIVFIALTFIRYQRKEFV